MPERDERRDAVKPAAQEQHLRVEDTLTKASDVIRRSRREVAKSQRLLRESDAYYDERHTESGNSGSDKEPG